MLTLVRSSSEGQGGGRPPRNRHRNGGFTPAQLARIRATLRNLRAAYGSWSCLAEVTGYAPSSLATFAAYPERAGDGVIARLALASGMTVAEILSPGLVPAANVCPTCGRKVGAS